MIVSAFKQVCDRRHREVFFTNVPQVGKTQRLTIITFRLCITHSIICLELTFFNLSYCSVNKAFRISDSAQSNIDVSSSDSFYDFGAI